MHPGTSPQYMFHSVCIAGNTFSAHLLFQFAPSVGSNGSLKMPWRISRLTGMKTVPTKSLSRAIYNFLYRPNSLGFLREREIIASLEK